jgi:hypothetical protein
LSFTSYTHNAPDAVDESGDDPPLRWLFHATRSGSANLNSAISGNSWYKAGLKAVWQKGVSNEEEGIGAA